METVRRRAVLPLAMLLLAASAARAAVTIIREPAVVEGKTFDPAHRPADMPPLNGNEAAVTQSKFECRAGISYELVSRREENGRCTTTIRVDSVQMTLQLKIVIWLPQGAPRQLVAHEEGHRQIDQRVYDGTEPIAREIATALDGKTVSGQGDTCQAAQQQATDSISGKLCRRYIRRVATPADQVSAAYDRITAHGTRAQPAVEEAIRQAFAAEHPKTAPTAGK